MKILFVKDENQSNEEITITYGEESDVVRKLRFLAVELNKENSKLEMYMDNSTYYIDVSSIMFFETDDCKIVAHTKDDMFYVDYKLYELEELLPSVFVRIAKSSIVNVRHIYSIEKNLSSSSCIEFADSHKTVYVSRRYYKILKNKIDEMRNR
jgi:DNA-binding LytR/AlgR family response regulator